MMMVTVIAVLVLFGAFSIVWVQYTVDARERELSRQVTALALGPEAVPLPGAQLDSELRMRLFRVQAGIIGARLLVTDAEGRVLFASSPEGGLAPYDIESLGAPDARGARSSVIVSPSGGRTLVVAAPIEEVEGYIVAVQPLSEVSGAGVNAALLLGAAALMAVLVGWLAGGIFARRVSARIVRLGEAAEAIAEGEWGRQVEVEGDDEIATLARSFNRMSSSVARAYRSQKEFVGDVSHELRTPITAIQGFATALADGTASSAEARERALMVLMREAGRLGELTEALLALAELDAGQVVLDRSPVDPSAIGRELAERHDEAAKAAGVSLEIGDLAAAGRPLGDEARILQVVSQLVANALAYTPRDGTVRVSAEESDGWWRLTVDDSGPGIPIEDRERVFERFVRLDSSRAGGSGGTGLGLAIARQLLRLMDGRIRVTDSALGGSRFEVELPLAAQGAH
jgi:Signal transduction histidine kinase